MGEGHLPVLVDEVLASLDPRTGSSIADCTVGGGGHADRLLEATSPDGRLLGLDADRAAIVEAHRVLAQYGDRVVLRQANFEAIYDVAREESFIPLDGDPVRPGPEQLPAGRPDAGLQLHGRFATGHAVR